MYSVVLFLGDPNFEKVVKKFFFWYTEIIKYTPKLFIETSVFNFYFEGKQGQK